MAFFKDTGYAQPSIEEVQKKAPIATAVNNDVINAGRSFAKTANEKLINPVTKWTGGQLLQKGVDRVAGDMERMDILSKDPTAPNFRPREDYATNNPMPHNQVVYDQQPNFAKKRTMQGSFDPSAEQARNNELTQGGQQATSPNAAPIGDRVGRDGVPLTRGTWHEDDAKKKLGIGVTPPESQSPILLTNKGIGNEKGVIQESYEGQLADTRQAIQNKRFAQAGMQPRQQNTDGSYQVGNMDVSFPANTTSQQAAAFMRDPVRTPPSQVPASSVGERGFIRPDYGWGKDKKDDGGLMYTKENHPEIGWKTRADLNLQNMRDKSQEGVNAVNTNNSIRAENASRFATQVGADSSRFATQVNGQTTTDANAIRSLEAQGNRANSIAQARSRTLANESAQNLVELQRQYGQETDPAKKKTILDQIQAMNGKGGKTDAPYTNIQAQDVMGADGRPSKVYMGFNTQTNRMEEIPVGE